MTRKIEIFFVNTVKSVNVSTVRAFPPRWSRLVYIKAIVLFLLRMQITQIEFAQRAPAGCLQYFQGLTGTVQTMNFAINGRHLANQDYVICIRQEQSTYGQHCVRWSKAERQRFL